MVFGGVFSAIRSHDQNPLTADRTRPDAQEFQATLIGPVQVIEQHDEGRALAISAKKSATSAKSASWLRMDAKASASFTNEGSGGSWSSMLVRTQGFGPRPIWRRRGQVVAATPQHQAALILGLTGQPLHQRGLADARLTTDQHQRAVTSQHVVERLMEQGLLALATDEHGTSSR